MKKRSTMKCTPLWISIHNQTLFNNHEALVRKKPPYKCKGSCTCKYKTLFAKLVAWASVSS